MSQNTVRNGEGNILLSLFRTFFHIGLFTIGGGYAMIPLIENAVVERRQWISKQDLVDLIAIAQSCPGIFAINISIFIGYKLRGIRGALVSTIGAALPSFLIILGIAMFFQQFQDVEIVQRIFRGIRPAVVALIAAPVFRMARTVRINRYNAWIPIASAALIWLFGISPLYIIIAAGVGGFVWGQYICEEEEE